MAFFAILIAEIFCIDGILMNILMTINTTFFQTPEYPVSLLLMTG